MKLAAVGDNCIDLYNHDNSAYPGGNPINVAVYFMRMGGSASYTGAVGTDKYGQLMIDALEDKGVDISHIKILKGNTAVTHVDIVNGDRVFGEYDEGVLTDFRLESKDIDFLCEHDILISGLWGLVENNLEQLHSKGMLVAFDAATRPDDPACIIALPNTDYFFFANDDGDTPDLREKIKELHGKGPKIVVATLGEKGSIAFDGNDFTQYGIKACDVVDTMGAGDSYIAGFLYGMLKGATILECMELGASSSSVTLKYQGAW